MFMNDYDLAEARSIYTRKTMPNRLALVMVVDNLRKWTDGHSDGWGYWPKPSRAAGSAMSLTDRAYSDTADITDTEMRLAVRPVGAFCTRQQRDGHMTADAREIILRAVNELRCPDCGGTGAVPISGGEAEGESDSGYKACPTCNMTRKDEGR